MINEPAHTSWLFRGTMSTPVYLWRIPDALIGKLEGLKPPRVALVSLQFGGFFFPESETMKNLAVVGRIIDTASIPNADLIIQATVSLWKGRAVERRCRKRHASWRPRDGVLAGCHPATK